MFTGAMGGQFPPSNSLQGDTPADTIVPSPPKAKANGPIKASQGDAANSNGKAADAMTAFWLAVNAKGIGREQGQAILQQAGGDPAIAITQL
jgi:hypothetical protein